ncbi:MAG TPA: TRAM domain-containing protein, partial [Agitococcus sp.]|nr:TRAM domain-containing protein [Agitococcus sp.]
AMLGTTQRVLVEKVFDRDQDYMVGSAENTRQVLLPRNDALIGKFADVVIDQIMSINTVRGHEIVWME